MRILLLHADKLKFEITKKALKDVKMPEQKKQEFEDCLSVFWVAEEGDKNIEQVVENAATEIKEVAKQVNEKKIILYPYVHLLFGSKPAPMSTALKIEKKLEEKLKNDFEVGKAPFGFYKSFKINVKGHPLSELSRVITSEGKKKKEEEDVSEALKKEDTLKSKWYIFEPSGKLNEIEMDGDKVKGFDFSNYKNLEKFVKYEMKKVRATEKEPPHIKLMKKMELVDYEPGSDPGNLRYYPKGRMIKALLEEWVTKNVLDYGAMEVETPVMYDFEHPSMKKYLNRFPARQYVIETPNKKTFLRFAACFGQFLIAHDAGISYKNLPLRLYELTKYSFRVEQRGELAGLRRLRGFTMPDCHAFCKDIEQSKEEMMKRLDLSKKIQEGIGFNVENDFELAIRITEDFYRENKEFVKELASKMGKPVLIEMWKDKFFYFVLKYEWNFVDALDKASALTTDQFDVENAETYGITYTDEKGKKRNPIILHLSPSGAIERVMYAFLEKTYMEQQKGNHPTFPLWLSPTQIRLCPVSESHKEFVNEIADKMERENIRVEIDDRNESVQKKIRDGEIDWVPLIVVIGDKEKESGTFPVRFRGQKDIKNMPLDEMISHIKEKTKDKPWKPLPVPREMTKQVRFVG